jgi:hypothetical protein
MRRQGLGTAAVIGGLVVVVLAQRLVPVARPLYDGVVVEDPYAWLSPPPGLAGGAKSAQETDSVNGVGFGVGTPEQPPQAQVISDFGSLDLPSGTTSVTVTIKPVPSPSVQPADGVIAGNVYSIELTNQRGAEVGISSGGQVTMLLRGPTSLPSATIELFSGGAWSDLQTESAGVPDMYTTLLSAFGDYALVAPQGWLPAGVKGTPPTPAASSASLVPATAVPIDTGATPEASAAAASGAAPVAQPSPVASDALPPGGSGGSGPPWAQIAAVVAAVVIVAAAGFVMMRPVKPPPG